MVCTTAGWRSTISDVSSYGKSKPPSAANVYRVTKKYFIPKISADLKKTVALLGGNCKGASIIYIPCVCEILMSKLHPVYSITCVCICIM